MSDPDFDHIDEAHFRRLMTERMDAAATQVEAIAEMVATKAQPEPWRSPSLAHRIAGGGPHSYQSSTAPGEFIKAIAFARSHDAREQEIGKATLSELGVRYVDDPGTAGRMFIDAAGKATLGTTDATGGWIIPNAIVDRFTKPEGYENVYRNLVSVRTGINSAAVDVPFRSARPARAVIAAAGATKENVDLTYNGYTATMYTLARIYDVGNQYLRQSAGAAEADVLEELRTAIALGEAYYMRDGTGSSQPFGIVPALTNGPSTYRSSHTPTSTTLAGSVLKAITTCIGALAARGVTKGLSAVISGTAWGTMIGQGTDTAGFFINGLDGPLAPGIAPGTVITPWGIPVYVDDQATDDTMIVGQFSSLKLYVGQDWRIDSSNQAGTRWDTNETGFRGEEDIAFDARAAVYAGRFQMVTDLLP